MVDLEAFVVSARFGPVTGGADQTDIVAAYGEPEFVEPARRSTPAMLVYGDVEFRLRDDSLSALSVKFDPTRPSAAAGIAVTGFWPVTRREMARVADLLRSNGVSWRVDEVMSRTNPQESSQTWITDRNVHLAFYVGTLDAVTADYSGGESDGRR